MRPWSAKIVATGRCVCLVNNPAPDDDIIAQNALHCCDWCFDVSDRTGHVSPCHTQVLAIKWR